MNKYNVALIMLMAINAATAQDSRATITVTSDSDNIVGSISDGSPLLTEGQFVVLSYSTLFELMTVYRVVEATGSTFTVTPLVKFAPSELGEFDVVFRPASEREVRENTIIMTFLMNINTQTISHSGWRLRNGTTVRGNYYVIINSDDVRLRGRIMYVYWSRGSNVGLVTPGFYSSFPTSSMPVQIRLASSEEIAARRGLGQARFTSDGMSRFVECSNHQYSDVKKYDLINVFDEGPFNGTHRVMYVDPDTNTFQAALNYNDHRSFVPPQETQEVTRFSTEFEC